MVHADPVPEAGADSGAGSAMVDASGVSPPRAAEGCATRCGDGAGGCLAPAAFTIEEALGVEPKSQEALAATADPLSNKAAVHAAAATSGDAVEGTGAVAGSPEGASAGALVAPEAPSGDPNATQPGTRELRVAPMVVTAEGVKPSLKPEGGLGFGGGLPTAASPPHALTPGSMASVQGMGPTALGCTAAESAARAVEAVGAAVDAKADATLPPAKSTYKEGRLRTTVNTPECLVSEADVEAPLEPEQYMYYAQQYAALAQQYAAYAQYCAQFAPQAAVAAATSTAGAGGTVAKTGDGASSAQQAPRSTPIMVTPYRHNWLISGAHRAGGGDSAWLDGLKGDVRKSIGALSRYVGGCRSCTPACATDSSQCKQM